MFEGDYPKFYQVSGFPGGFFNLVYHTLNKIGTFPPYCHVLWGFPRSVGVWLVPDDGHIVLGGGQLDTGVVMVPPLDLRVLVQLVIILLVLTVGSDPRKIRS